MPEDLSVAGFDDSDLSRATRLQLTTVRQPLAEIGRIAVGLLVRLMEGQEVEPSTSSWRPSSWSATRPDLRRGESAGAQDRRARAMASTAFSTA